MRNLDNELQRLIDFANKHKNIRGLVLQGSYINPNAPIDVFSDLDPLFYVVDVNEWIHDLSWKSEFGEVVSEWGDGWDMKDGLNGYTRLTLFKDGFKLDFGFQDIRLAQYAFEMPLYKVYVDKDNIIPAPEVTDERKFYVQMPKEEEFNAVLVDFFFDTSYVVKTIYREELFFQKYMFGILHKKIYDLVRWYIGCKFDFQVNTGSMGRYFKRYLSKEEWELLERTYSGSCIESNVRALLTMFELVHFLGNKIADRLGFTYPDKLNNDMLLFCTTLIDKYISSSQDHQGSCKSERTDIHEEN